MVRLINLVISDSFSYQWYRQSCTIQGFRRFSIQKELSVGPWSPDNYFQPWYKMSWNYWRWRIFGFGLRWYFFISFFFWCNRAQDLTGSRYLGMSRLSTGCRFHPLQDTWRQTINRNLRNVIWLLSRTGYDSVWARYWLWQYDSYNCCDHPWENPKKMVQMD